MANANADVLETWLESSEHFTRHFSPASGAASWLSPHDEAVAISRTQDGFLTRWTSESTLRKSVTTSRPTSVAIARILTLREPMDTNWARGESCLCVATSDIIHVCAPAGDLFECPLPKSASRKAAFTKLFTSVVGLVVEVEQSETDQTRYFSALHPLEEMCRISNIPDDHRLLFMSMDMPIAVTQGTNEWTVWSVLIKEVQAAEEMAGKTEQSSKCRVDTDGDVGMRCAAESGIDPDWKGGDHGVIPSNRNCMIFERLISVPLSITSASASCCQAHAGSGDLLLYVCAAGTLTALSVNMPRVEQISVSIAFTMSGISAVVGVLASRRKENALDVLALDMYGGIGLYAGQLFLCRFRLRLDLGGLDADDVLAGIVSMRDGVGCRATLVHADGTYSRISVGDLAPACPLVDECLAAISCACADMSDIENPGLLLRQCLLSRRLAQYSSADDRDEEWVAFVSTLLSLCSNFEDDPGPCREETPESRVDGRPNGNEDWAFLLASEHHAQAHDLWMHSRRPNSSNSAPRPLETSPSAETAHEFTEGSIGRIVESLHLLYEARKLNKLNSVQQARLAVCNAQLAATLGLENILDHYRRDFGELCEFDLRHRRHRTTAYRWAEVACPNIFEKLTNCVQECGKRSFGEVSIAPIESHDSFQGANSRERDGRSAPFPRLEADTVLTIQPPCLVSSWRTVSPLRLVELVTRYFEMLFCDDSDLSNSTGAVSPGLAVVHAMSRDGFNSGDLDSLPFGVALPLRDALWSCRETPGDDLPKSGEVLIGREDLWTSTSIGPPTLHPSKDSAYAVRQIVDDVISRHDSARSGGENRALLHIHAASATFDDDGMGSTWAGEAGSESVRGDTGQGHVISSRSQPGRRSGVVEGDGDLPISGHPSNRFDGSADAGDGCEMLDGIFAHRFGQDRRVLEVRRLLRSTEPLVLRVASRAEDDTEEQRSKDHQSKLTVLLRRHLAAPVGRGAYTLQTFTPTDPTLPLSIPKICLEGKIAGQKGARVYFNPQSAPYALDWGEFHNGVAAGLRLVASDPDGQQDSSQILTRTWIVNHRPSSTAGNSAHAGMLLSLGLGGYLPALRATDYYEYLVPRHDLTSIGLMLGVSAGNRGSFHAKITKMLCVHIRHFNEHGFAVPDFQVSLVVQTAAVLGLGLLYQGTSEHLIVEGLLSELVRRPKPGDPVRDRESLSLAAGFALGLTCLGVGSSAPALVDLHVLDTLFLYALGGADPGVSQNLGAAAGNPGTGLDSHHHNSRKAVHGNSNGLAPVSADSETSRLKESGFIDVDVTGPGALMALALIHLKSNDANVASRILVPDTMYALDRARPDHVYLRSLAKHLILWDSITPTISWVRTVLPALLRPPDDSMGSAEIDLQKLWLDQQDDPLDSDIDERGILFARAFAVAAACTAIALRFAGSMDSRALSVISGLCVGFEKCLLLEVEFDKEAEWVYITCLNAAALGLSIVAAGSGDLTIFRLLRRLRKRSGISREHRYGMHMAMHMALGFLFLGGGCQSFGTSSASVAALLCAIYPRFPSEVMDNRYHLQAMRHLYVLAVEPRCIETRDVESDMPCYVSLEVNLKRSATVHMKSRFVTAPCLLPDARFIKNISVVSERYLPKTFIVPAPCGQDGWFSPTRRLVVYVKRRAGHLPHAVDPSGSKGMLARSFGRLRRGEQGRIGLAHLVRAFSADPNMLAFVRHFCESDPAGKGESSTNSDFYGEVLYECLSLDKPAAVQCYLEVARALGALRNSHPCPAVVGSLVLSREYALSQVSWGPDLVRRDYLWSAAEEARKLYDGDAWGNGISLYAKSGGKDWKSLRGDPNPPIGTTTALGRALQLHRIPGPSDLTTFRESGASLGADRDDIWLTLGVLLPPDTPECALDALCRSMIRSNRTSSAPAEGICSRDVD